MGFFPSHAKRFCEIEYKSVSHTFNKAVIASYYNVEKYGYRFDGKTILIQQKQRELVFCLKGNKVAPSERKQLIYSEQSGEQEVKEVCYDLKQLFETPSTEMSRGIRFSSRPEVSIIDYKVDENLDKIYETWKLTKETDGKTYLIAFNPKRYYRSYHLKKMGFNIYQKMILIRNIPYALINFALDGEWAYELSFLSLFKQKELRLINDQNDCIMINCLHDLYSNHGIKSINLGTTAGIKGLSIFKKKFPHFEQIVYSTVIS